MIIGVAKAMIIIDVKHMNISAEHDPSTPVLVTRMRAEILDLLRINICKRKKRKAAVF
jgi:hypothetical protein